MVRGQGRGTGAINAFFCLMESLKSNLAFAGQGSGGRHRLTFRRWGSSLSPTEHGSAGSTSRVITL